MEADRPRGRRASRGRSPVRVVAAALVCGALVGACSLGATASAAPRLIAVPTSAPVGTGSSDGVHPGAIVQTDIGLCTMNFLFSGSDGARYMATAGHCVLGSSDPTGDINANAAGENTWAPGTGPAALDSAGRRIGTFVYAILQDPKDFSLIRLDPAVSASPAVEYFGGPTGIDGDLGSRTVTLEYFGNGLGTGSTLPARTALAFGTPDPDHVYAQGLVTPGDSGAPIETSDGRAVGVVVTTGVHLGSLGSGGLDAGTMGVTRLGPQVARAAQVLHIALTLSTSPPQAPSGGRGAAPGSGAGSTGSPSAASPSRSATRRARGTRRHRRHRARRQRAKHHRRHGARRHGAHPPAHRRPAH